LAHVFKLKFKYKQTKYEGNMTETSSKGVLRLTIAMFLSVGLVDVETKLQNRRLKD
jgi:hypothetical protein